MQTVYKVVAIIKKSKGYKYNQTEVLTLTNLTNCIGFKNATREKVFEKKEK